MLGLNFSKIFKVISCNSFLDFFVKYSPFGNKFGWRGRKEGRENASKQGNQLPGKETYKMKEKGHTLGKVEKLISFLGG